MNNEGKESLINEPSEPVTIPGKFFSIAYRDVKNINLRFISVDISEEGIKNLSDDMPSEKEIEEIEKVYYQTLSKKYGDEPDT